ncbi:MAG: zinc-ribbon domain-containing protein [Candidatus Bathyarchaeia archaeon]
MKKKQSKLTEKIAEANRFRRIAVLGLTVSIPLIFLGQLFLPVLFIIGYTVFIVCTGITSFFTVLKWQYGKALKQEREEKEKPPPAILCPRCGVEVGKTVKYCPKCGKKIQAKKQ